MSTNRILVADDHPLIRIALRQALTEAENDLEVCEAGSLEAIAEILEQDTQFDLVLLDLNMPGSCGLSGFIFVRTLRPEIPVVIVSTAESPGIIRLCKQIGAAGYLPKSTCIPTLREALRDVLDGIAWFPGDIAPKQLNSCEIQELATRLTTLTPQQMRTLMLLCKGKLNKEIGRGLGISEATVKAHVSAILRKLEVHSRTHAVIALNRITALPQTMSAS